MNSQFAIRNSQLLLCFKGHPGTGKSTLARSLARHLNWPLIDKDDIKDHTWTLTEGNKLSYEIMWQMTETQLSNGLSVLVDSPFARPHLYETARAIARRHRVRLLVVQTTLPIELWQQRLNKRSANPSSHKPSSWADMQEQLAVYKGIFNYPIAPEHLVVVDTSLSIPEQIETVMRRIRNK